MRHRALAFIFMPKDLFCLVDAGREVGRSALIGMKFHHHPPVSSADLLFFYAWFQAKHLVGLVCRHAGARASRPRLLIPCRTASMPISPTLRSTIKKRFHQQRTLSIGGAKLV